MGISTAIVRAHGGTIHRGPRRKVLLRARMRAGGPKMDVCIRDISARGLLVQAGTPPPRGTYVEVLCAGPPIVGKVVWAGDRRFGIAVQDAIDIDTFIEDAEHPESAARPPPARKAKARLRITHAGTSFDASRGLANGLQFAAVGIACAAAAVGIAWTLYDRLSGALGTVATHL